VEKAQMFGNPPIKAVNFVKLVIAIILELEIQGASRPSF